jgi:hypothetical protein
LFSLAVVPHSVQRWPSRSRTRFLTVSSLGRFARFVGFTGFLALRMARSLPIKAGKNTVKSVLTDALLQFQSLNTVCGFNKAVCQPGVNVLPDTVVKVHCALRNGLYVICRKGG